MTNWKKFIQTRHIKEGHFDVAAFELTPEDFKWLKKACIKAKKESLKHNKHVIIDKPITLSFSQTNKLLNLARKKNLFNFRSNSI